MTYNIQKQQRDMTYESAFNHAHRGEWLYTDRVTLRLSSMVTMALFRSIHPSLITLANLLVGVSASLLAILGVNAEPTWMIGLLVTIGWQLAYVLDSADGQVARAAGKTSSAGAVLDILCDFAVQSTIVVALCVAVSHDNNVPVALVALFAATWMVNLIVTILLRGTNDDGHRVLSRRPLFAALFKISHDYGLLLLILGMSYTLWRALLFAFMMGVLAMNLLFLAAMIVIEMHSSILATRSLPGVGWPSLETEADEKAAGIPK